MTLERKRKLAIHFTFAMWLATTVHAADVYVGQTSAGTASGTSAANRIAYSALNWGTLADDRLCVVGTITTAFSIGAHGSLKQFILDLSCDSTNQGAISVTGSSAAITLPGGAGRFHTTIRNGKAHSAGGPGVMVRGTDTGGISDVTIENMVLNDNTIGISLVCDAAATYRDVTIRNNVLDRNKRQGINCSVTAGIVLGVPQRVAITDLTISGNTFTDNGDSPVKIYDATSAAPQDDATCNIVWGGMLTIRGNRALRGGHVGYRIGNAGHCHAAGGSEGGIRMYGNTGNLNGNGERGGGALVTGFGHSETSPGSGVDALGYAWPYSPFGGQAANWCYLGDNIFNQNAGQNSGINWFASKGCVVERNEIKGTTCADGLRSNGSGARIIDCNGIISDEETTYTLFQFNESSGHIGNSQPNSGAALMVLRRNSHNIYRYNYGGSSHSCLWVTGRDQDSNVFYNNTFTDCISWGIRHDATLNNEFKDITIRNNIFTARASATNTGHLNGANGNVIADHNIFYGFDTVRSGQAAGAGDSPATTNGKQVDPLLAGVTFKSAADYKLSSMASIAYNTAAKFSDTKVDAAGVTVPQGGLPDIGAFEFVTPSTHMPER